jgi:hypothetical protein
MQGIFENAFGNMKEGFGGFFQSVAQGFEKLLQDMAAKYLASQLANVFMNLLGPTLAGVFGGGGGATAMSGGSLGDVLGGAKLAAAGGPVVPGQKYIVGEQGPELLTMGGRGGYITPHARMAGAGGPNITFNISTPDVSGFQRSRNQIAADWHRESENARKRNGG